jgi:molecular chaperone DnaK (HSP70)
MLGVQEGLADCIANDDGERQIPTAVSFNGTEEVSSGVDECQLGSGADKLCCSTLVSLLASSS